MKKNKKLGLFFFAIIAVPFTAFAIMQWYQQRLGALPYFGPEDHRIGDFRFTGQEGKTLSEKDWEGKIVVANFFFTHCMSICPKMMYQLKRVDADAGTQVLINSFTVDPERDSAGQLKAYANRLGVDGKWMLLTGDKKTLYRFARTELMIDATDGDGGPDDFIHSDRLVLIDQQKRIRGYYDGTDAGDVDRLIRDIKKLEH